MGCIICRCFLCINCIYSAYSVKSFTSSQQTFILIGDFYLKILNNYSYKHITICTLVAFVSLVCNDLVTASHSASSKTAYEAVGAVITSCDTAAESELEDRLQVPLADKPEDFVFANGSHQFEKSAEDDKLQLSESAQGTIVTEESSAEFTEEQSLQLIDTQYTSGGFEIGEYVSVPTDLPTSVKLATDYHCYNLRGTPHWRLQQRAWTDEYGFRRFNDDYIVGMGTYYSIDIGDRFEVTYDTGKVMTVILGDNKADVLTDTTRRYEPVTYWDMPCASVLEFIADLEAAPDDIWIYGTYDYLEEFKGNIVSMKYLGRDTSADWDTYF